MDYRDLPYDAEIEYLESTGTQYIDTGIPLFSDMQMTITFRLKDNANNTSIIGSAVKEGYRVADRKQMYLLANYPYNNKWYIALAHNTSTGAGYTGTELLDDFGTVIVHQNKLIVNGVEYSDVNVSPFFAGGNCFLFWSDGTHEWLAQKKALIRLKRFLLKDSANILVRDMIPVRVGNVGYLFDKVSGQLFGNSGTGAFILGSDVAPGRYANEIAFLESTGSQYIDNVYTDNASANEAVFDFKVNGTGDIIGNKGSGDIYANGTKIVGINSGVGAFAYYKPTDARVLLQLNSGENSLTNIVTTFSKTTSTFTIEADGETLSGAYSGIARNEPYTMLVRDSNLTVGYFVGKIYSGKIYEDGVLVRDFIPVEYNNIGYLYDKVSGQFFANQGTGKFVLGHRAPRFDGKACARSYTRRQLMAEIAYPKPYISNGLIFHLDGKDANGSTWVDRIGGKVLTLYNTTLQNGGVRFTGNRHCCAETEDGVTLTAPAASSTIEIVGHRLTKRSIEMIFSPGVNSSIFYVGRNTYVSLGVNVRLAQFTAPLPVGKFTHSLRATLHYYNGTKMTTTGSTVASNQETNICVGGNETAAGNLGFNGIIYQIRIYNRLLTEDEIKWNQEQDRKRYGIQF